METIGIVIPTYNASESIIETLKKIKHELPKARVIIVDDNSPDKTADLVSKTFAIKDKHVEVLKRAKKNGRGSAVLAGLKKLYTNEQVQYFVEMDADLCHDPKYIKDLVAMCRKADIVIASRYLAGSRIYGWNIKRKLMSRVINTVATILLRIPITDYTDGFRCYSRKAVELLCSYTLQSKGYIVLSESAYICYKNGLRFAEIPIDFHFQTKTKSNLTVNEIKEALLTLVKLKLTNYG